MRLAIDTNCYRDLCDGKRELVERLETAEAIFVPFVVLAELRAGGLPRGPRAEPTSACCIVS